jgi:hypothetical protein
MKRWEFITLIGASTIASSFTARAQQAERVRRIGVANHFRYSAIRRRWKSGGLWARYWRHQPACKCIRGSHSQGRAAGKFAGAIADKVRTRCQSEDSQGARPVSSRIVLGAATR